jgi:hypothetical protein
LLSQIERDGREKRACTEEREIKEKVIKEKNDEISSLREEAQVEKEQKNNRNGETKIFSFH